MGRRTGPEIHVAPPGAIQSRPANWEKITDRQEVTAICRAKRRALDLLVYGFDPEVEVQGVDLVRRAFSALPKLPGRFAAEVLGVYRPAHAQRTRLRQRKIDHLDAFRDPDTGDVHLLERTIPLPPAIAKQICPQESLKKLRQLPVDSPDQGAADLVLAGLAAVLPSSAVTILSRSDLLFRVGDPNSEYKRWGPKKLGLLSAPLWSHLRGALDAALVQFEGLFDMVTLEVYIGDFLYGRLAPARTTALHEVMHALDFALGKPGQFLSSEEPWRKIFAHAVDESRRFGDLGGFPTVYSAKDACELFAESAAVFLGNHVDGLGGESDVVVTRADLQRVNYPAYAFLVDLFSRVVPQRAREGARVGKEAQLALLEAQIRWCDAYLAYNKGSFEGRMRLSIYHLLHARLSGDRKHLELAGENARLSRVPLLQQKHRLKQQRQLHEALVNDLRRGLRRPAESARRSSETHQRNRPSPISRARVWA